MAEQAELIENAPLRAMKMQEILGLGYFMAL